ncbi:MAG: ABC transporter permease subunit [Anaerolineales bacterium]|nr:ABC transporter permease subunit [Anaerolineales bacterium]
MVEPELITLPNNKPTLRDKIKHSALARLVSYTTVRVFTLILMVVISVYLTILVANLGGFLDEVLRANIDENIGMMLLGGWLKDVTDEDERNQTIEQTRAAMIEASGLNEPFLLRCLQWLWKGLTLDWGKARVYVIFQRVPTAEVKYVILDHLPRTLLVFGSANILLFFVSLGLALGISRKYGSWQDKLVTALAPLAAAPSWVYGLIISGFSIQLFNTWHSSFDQWPPGFQLSHLSFYFKHMYPAVLAIFISKLFQSIYAWRTLFLIHSSEDYVEIAKAKGMPGKLLQRRYILRPVLPNVLTTFALMIVGLWQEVIILETVFSVAGVGHLFRDALGFNDIRTIVGLVVTFAYMLAITMFLLEIAYALVDPRVRIGGESRLRQNKAIRRWGLLTRLRRQRNADLPKLPGQAPPAANSHTTATAKPEWKAPPLEKPPPPIEQAPLLRDLILHAAGPAQQAAHDYVLESGKLLVEAGLLINANDVFWLTKSELKSAIRDCETGKSLHPFNQIIRQRRLAQLAGQAARPSLAVLIPQASTVAQPAKPLGSHPVRQRSQRLKASLHELHRYRPVIAGAAIILVLVVISIYAIIALPYNKAVKLWRGDDMAWLRYPTYALPTWVNWFRADDLPETINLSSRDEIVSKTTKIVSENTRTITFSLAFDYPYSHYPKDLIIFFEADYDEKKPLIALLWRTPDGREIDLGSFSILPEYSYYVFQDEKLLRKLNAANVNQGLFGDPQSVSDPISVLPGKYELEVTAFVFEENADIDADFVLYGQVHGWAGTDGRRRDALIGLLWGAPVALAFGLLAAAGTTLTTITISAIGTWFGGWLDQLIQRLTEVNMILPFFPVSLMIYTLYSKSFWVILGVTVLLNVFGSGIKNYRSLFLQVKELPYFEAAQAYGASNWRIIFRYLIPRIGTILIPQMVILVPSYVFLEAGLSVLGLYDPLTPPTWGQLILDGLTTGIHQGAYHLFLEPAFFLMLTGYAFLLLGISLERILEPRLREI